jgi:hypothetical protein
MITEQDILKYLDPNFPEHQKYQETIAIARALQVHSKGEYPEDLLDADRPGEEPTYKAYRTNKLFFSPITKGAWGKISSTTDKIRLAEDWKIEFKDPKGAVAKGESLKEYTEENYPLFDSLVNWFFTLGKKRMEDDPNGAIAVYPIQNASHQTDYVSPFTFIYPSECIIDFEENNFCAILCKEKSLVTQNRQQVREGRIYLFFDRDTMIKSVQFGDINKPEFNHEITNHNIKYMPVWKFGGIVKSFEDNMLLYDSFFSPVLAGFNEAICRYSDHQVNMVKHLHPKEWGLVTSECRVCKGSKVIQERNYKGSMEQKSCPECHGLGGVQVETPWMKTLVNPATKIGPGNNAVSSISGPPGGYLERPMDSIAFLKQEYKDKIQEGYDSLNLGFINQVPLDTSGISKSYDRQEMNAFFSTMASHIIENILSPCYYFISKWRYPFLSENDLSDNLPKIKVPAKFDIAISDILVQRVKTAVDGNFNPLLINALQIQYAENELGKEHPTVKKMIATFSLDPLPNLTVTEKNEIMVNSAQPGTDYRDYVLSINLPGFIERAINEDEGFLDQSYIDQMKVLDKYVEEIAAKESKVIPIVNNQGVKVA